LWVSVRYQQRAAIVDAARLPYSRLVKVVKPGTPLPPGIREKLESSRPVPAARPTSSRPSVPFTAKASRPPSFTPPGKGKRSITPLGMKGVKSMRPKGARYSSIPPPNSSWPSPPPMRPPSTVPTGFQSHGLDEVERALSVLGGRHPDAERVEREVRAEREWRLGQIAVEAKVASHQRRMRRVLQTLFAIVTTVVAVVAVVAVQHYRRADTQMALLAGTYTRLGFTPWIAPSWPRGNRLEATLDGPACLVGLGTGTSSESGGAPHLRIERSRAGDGPAPLVDEVTSSAAWCGCRGEHVTLIDDATDEPMTRLLRIDPRAVGDHVGLELLDTPVQKVLDSRNHDCDDGAFAGWLNDGHPEPRARDAYDAWVAHRDLESAGFTYLGSALPSDHLLPLKSSAERCTLVRSESPGDVLTLRFGGEDPVRLTGRGVIGWCATQLPASTVAREGHGAVMALDVDAVRIGGGLGVLEWVARARVAGDSFVPWVPPGDLGWDAKNALLASGAPDAQVTAGDGIAQHVSEARLVSIATAASGGGARADGAGGADGQDGVYGCVPAFGGARTVCEQAGPLTWRVVGDPRSTGIAQAKLPFWLSAMNGLDTTRAQEAAARLLAFARRLHALGYRATSSDGIEELPTGVQVHGVGGADQIIAVGVGNEEPFVLPYTDAPPWTLDGTPRAVPIAQGQVLKLISVSGRDLPPANRRTVVFRHQVLP
jgi:hypothetical protein